MGEIIVRYFEAIVKFAGLQIKNDNSCPFQIDSCFVFDQCHVACEVVEHKADDDEKKKKEAVDDGKDSVGLIEEKLKNNNLKYSKIQLGPEERGDLEYPTYIKIRNGFESVLNRRVPHRKRYVTFVDRRKNKGASAKREKRAPEDWESMEPDDVHIFEPPSECSTIPKNPVPEYPFEASKTCLLPEMQNSGDDPLRNTSHCGGSMMTFSIHAMQSDVVKCYLYWNGQMVRFHPEDIRTTLHMLFNMKWNRGLELQNDLAKSLNEQFMDVDATDEERRDIGDVVETVKKILTDRHFANFHTNSP